MPAPFRLGFLTHLHGSCDDPAKRYRDYVELFVAAEELGFDSVWVAQHHFDASAGVLPIATDLILQFSPAAPPLGEAIAALELLATQVAPALGWQPGQDEAVSP